MVDEINEEVNEDLPDLSEMTDDEIMSMTEPPGAAPVEDENLDQEEEEPSDEEDTDDDAEEAEDDVDDEDEDVKPEPAAEEKEVVSDEAEPSADESTKEGEEDKSDEPPAIDYKAEYEKILSPFKANGKDVQMSSVDDAIRLMQMGSDYHHKMAGMKPSMKLLKMLDNNELLDEEKLNYLIDLDKKNPEAIAKLLKDSNIDPLDVDTSSEAEYTPNAYTVTDEQVELDTVLKDLEGHDSFSKTIDIIGNKWDNSSRKVLLDNPSIIKLINDHVDSGIYDQINKIVDNERMLGRLTELSDLDAYKQVGDVLQANGAFANQQQQTPPPATVDTSTQAPVTNPKLKDRKRAASSSKSAPGKKSKAKYNPLSLSDEEFEKIASGV